MRATLHTDGAARHKTGEPTGPAGIGAVLRSETGEVIREIAEGIGLATNNVAEYTASSPDYRWHAGVALAANENQARGTGGDRANAYACDDYRTDPSRVFLA
jgi:hypothetical protein